jgi:hypothetical protein
MAGLEWPGNKAKVLPLMVAERFKYSTACVHPYMALLRVVNTQWTGNMSDELLGTDMTTCNTLRWREVRRF